MSIGAIYADEDDLWCQLGELSDEQKAPFAKISFADDNIKDFHYGCDRQRYRYFIYPQNSLPAPPHGLIADMRSIRLLDDNYFSGQPSFSLTPQEISRLIDCAKKLARQKIKRSLK